MDIIQLQHVLPRVFSGQNYINSQVWHQDIRFERGKTYLIEAASGTGKSSMCSFVYGQRADYEGIITFDERNIRQLTAADWTDIRVRHLSLLFQELRLFPELTALENILLKNRLTGHKRKHDISELLEVLGLGDKTDSPIAHLSYGQQQRVAFARCLCQPCDFFLLDEPVSHLDPNNARNMANLLRQEADRQGAGIITTSVGNPLPLIYDHVLRL